MIDLKQYRRALAFFAHPDDETLAAGATLLAELTEVGALHMSARRILAGAPADA